MQDSPRYLYSIAKGFRCQIYTLFRILYKENYLFLWLFLFRQEYFVLLLLHHLLHRIFLVHFQHKPRMFRHLLFLLLHWLPFPCLKNLQPFFLISLKNSLYFIELSFINLTLQRYTFIYYYANIL